MMTMHGSIPIFWPLDTSGSDGFCYGWPSPLVCVAGLLQVESRDEADAIMLGAIHTKEWQAARHAHPELQDPVILGHFTLETPSRDAMELPDISIYPEHASPSKQPRLTILYRRPLRENMQFYALDHHELDILPSQQSPQHDPSTSARNAAYFSADFTAPRHDNASGLDTSVLQLNLSRYLADAVDTFRRPSSTGLSAPNSPALGLRTQPTTVPASDGDIPPPWSHFPRLLREFSATVEQFDVRFEQAQFVFTNIPKLWQKRKQYVTVKDICRYVRFYNCVWLVLNDVIIGVAIGSFLLENRQALSQILDYTLQHYLVDWIRDALMWLNNWPAGLKLNTELSSFLCHIFVGMVTLWGQLLVALSPYYPLIFWVAGAMGFFGMAAMISLLSDLLKFLTAHLWVCYWLSAIVFRQQLGFIGSLWNLFRGKRYNVLRMRLESWDYDIDQLLLGTILFTLTTFLQPTVMTYYALFATTRLLIIIIHAVLDTASALLNHFPLFALMLRIKDPLRLPGRITFSRTLSGSLKLQNEAAPLSFVFSHYAELGGRLFSHYHPVRLMRLLVSGRPIQPIQHTQIRFSMIPTTDSESTLSMQGVS